MTMTRKIMIQGEEYTLITNFKENEIYRRGLNQLTKKTFGFDFEDWYKAGYWGDRYIPYALLHQDKLVANVSANPLDFLVDGKRKSYLQLGTVMTDEAYRGKGLSRALMELVLKEYEGVELIFLYANDSVTEFYPKFGFLPADEYIHSKMMHRSGKQHPYRRLDMDSAEDRDLLFKLVRESIPAARISMLDNPGLVMFYLTKFMRENIYYLEEPKLAAVAEREGDALLLQDVFASGEFELDDVISSLMDRDTMKVVLGFTPKDTRGYDCEPLVEEGSTFFVLRNPSASACVPGQGRFPLLSHT